MLERFFLWWSVLMYQYFTLHEETININWELVGVKKHMRRNSRTANFLYGEVSLRRNIRTVKLHTANFPYGEISLRRNLLTAKFPTAKFATTKFPTPTDILPTDISPTDISPTVHFVDRYFADRTFCRSAKVCYGHFAYRYFADTHKIMLNWTKYLLDTYVFMK